MSVYHLHIIQFILTSFVRATLHKSCQLNKANRFYVCACARECVLAQVCTHVVHVRILQTQLASMSGSVYQLKHSTHTAPICFYPQVNTYITINTHTRARVSHTRAASEETQSGDRPFCCVIYLVGCLGTHDVAWREGSRDGFCCGNTRC